MSKRNKKPAPKSYKSEAGALKADEGNGSVKIARTSYSGPVPPPDLMHQYAQIDPTFPERLLAITEKQIEHQQELEQFVLRADAVIAVLGIISGVVVSVATIYFGAQVALAGSIAQSIAGTLLAGSGLASLVGTFVYGTKRTETGNKETKK